MTLYPLLREKPLRSALFVLLLAGLALAQVLVPTGGQAPASISSASFGGQVGGGTEVSASELTLPLKPGSVRFAVIGDSGTGDRAQREVADQMIRYREKFPFDFVVMLGDNIYGSDTPRDYLLKFEQPYKKLLEAGVKFYASLGNHDNPNQRLYKPFNMGGERYYTFSKGNVGFFALDSTSMRPTQLTWIEQQLRSANSGWKIAFFHHALYSDARFHGSDLDLRARIAPLFEKYGVNVVLSGHDHVYERFKAQRGIHYFVLGSSGKLRSGNLKPSAEMIKGFDTDHAFMLVEVAGDELFFQTISRTGKTVDSDMLIRQPAKSDITSLVK